MSRDRFLVSCLVLLTALTGCGKAKRERQQLAIKASLSLPRLDTRVTLRPIKDSFVINVEDVGAAGGGKAPYVIQGQRCSLPEVERILGTEAEQSRTNPQAPPSAPDRDILIRADRRVRYEHVQAAMLACAKHRLWKISFAAQGSEKAGWNDDREWVEGRIYAYLPHPAFAYHPGKDGEVRIRLRPPKEGSAETEHEPTIWLDEWECGDLGELARKLERLEAAEPRLTILIDADRQIHSEWVVRTLAACQRARFIDIILRAPGKGHHAIGRPRKPAIRAEDLEEPQPGIGFCGTVADPGLPPALAVTKSERDDPEGPVEEVPAVGVGLLRLDRLAAPGRWTDLARNALQYREEYIRRDARTYPMALTSLVHELKSRSAKADVDLLLVWLIDASESMRDAREAVSARLAKIHDQFQEVDERNREHQERAEGKESRKSRAITMSVVRFNKAPRLWLRPTSQIELVADALDTIYSDSTGFEGTMGAIEFCAKKFPTVRGRRTAIALVTDERGDDLRFAEPALQSLMENKVSLYVIGPEAVFGGTERYVKYLDTSGQERTGIATKGPESIIPEIPSVRWAGWVWPASLPSGFGVYELSRLSLCSGGTYYMIAQEQGASGEGARPATERYDWRVMRYYRPDLWSPDEYERRAETNPIRRTMRATVQEWNNKHGRVQVGVFRGTAVEGQLVAAEKALEECKACIKRLETVHVPTGKVRKLRSARWTAHVDLVLAQFRMAEYRLGQYYYALVDFSEQGGRRSADRFTVRSSDRILGGQEAKEQRQAVIRAYHAVSERHPETPWSRAAEFFDPKQHLHSYEVIKHVPPDRQKTRPDPLRPSAPPPRPI